MTREGRSEAHHEKLQAIRNAVKLGASLIFVWGIGLSMRLLVPRYLGPGPFGELQFADSFAATFFVALTFGADVYIRKEVPVHPEKASHFFGGVLVLRIAFSMILTGVIAVVLAVSHRPEQVRTMVYLFGAGQLFASLNVTLSAMLQSRGRVGGMSVLSGVTKVIWGLGFLAAIALKTGPWAFAASFLASEFVETFVLYALARKHLGLRIKWDTPGLKALLVFGFPFYLKTAAETAYAKMDVSFLAMGANDLEVGWYGAASTLANLALLIAPLMSWVMMPMFARAAARSDEELHETARRSMELVLSVSIPISLAIAVGADVWIRAVFGPSFGPSALSLRILAPMFVVTYVSIVCSMVLSLQDRGWALTAIAIAGFAANFGLNLVLIPASLKWLGVGGGGPGCATALLGTELLVTAAMLFLLGRHAVDRRVLLLLAKCAVACALAVALDRWLAFLGPVRLIPAAVGYVVLVLATRALPLREIVSMVRGAFERRGAPAAPS